MNHAKVIVLGLVMSIFFLNSGCTVTVTPTAPAKGYVKYLNSYFENPIGTPIYFKTRNLSGLAQTWPEEIPYGGRSSVLAVAPHSGPFTIAGEVCSTAAGIGSWSSQTGNFSNEIRAGDTVLLVLTSPAPTVGYVKFHNAFVQGAVGFSIYYKVRTLAGLGQSWPDEIPYGGQSALKTVTPHSGTFTISGEVYPASVDAGSWTAGTWTFSQQIKAGDTVVLTLD
jgi:hypothetical protein